MIKKILLVVILLFSVTDFLFAQEQFSVSIIQSSITSVPALHSGAFAKWNGKWIFIGGRTDGLHNFQTGLAFGTNHRNDSVFIVDPVLNSYVSTDLSVLPTAVYEAVCSSNMEYYQENSMLYMIGGYGYKSSIANKVTFPSLVAVNLDSLMDAVTNLTSVNTSFRQLIDTNFAVTGGVLQKEDSTYYLIFGHRFDGGYSADDSSNFFIQQYTNEIRKFTINDDGVNLSINNYIAIADTNNFHRRDLNVVPQIFPNGSKGFTAFAGVFQKNINLPYLTSIDITPLNVVHQSSFNENLNQYSTAVVPVYDSANNYMHTIFFGGISLYTLDTSSQNLLIDSLVPFVTTISKVTRDPSGNLSEYKLPVNMPTFIGTNSIFIPDSSGNLFDHEIVNLNPLNGNTHVGYIVGGIQSDSANVGATDPDGLSRASSQVFDVYINKSPNVSNDQLIRSCIYNFFVYPNPSQGKFNISFSLTEKTNTEIAVLNTAGKKVASIFDGTLRSGNNQFVWDGNKTSPGNYFCRIKTNGSVKTVKIVLEK